MGGEGRGRGSAKEEVNNSAGVPQVLFPTSARAGANQKFAVTKDGKRFLVSSTPQQSRAMPLTVVLNWTAAIQK
jgi:hypothetical protein